MARRMLVRITAELFQELITIGGWTIHRCVKGLPKGAELLSSHFDIDTQCTVLCFQHESFPDIEPTTPIPYLGITMEMSQEWNPAWAEKYRESVGIGEQHDTETASTNELYYV